MGPRADALEVIIQLGAILDVVWLYRSMLWCVARDGTAVAEQRRLVLALFVAVLSAAIVGSSRTTGSPRSCSGRRW